MQHFFTLSGIISLFLIMAKGASVDPKDYRSLSTFFGTRIWPIFGVNVNLNRMNTLSHSVCAETCIRTGKAGGFFVPDPDPNSNSLNTGYCSCLCPVPRTTDAVSSLCPRDFLCSNFCIHNSFHGYRGGVCKGLVCNCHCEVAEVYLIGGVWAPTPDFDKSLNMTLGPEFDI